MSEWPAPETSTWRSSARSPMSLEVVEVLGDTVFLDADKVAALEAATSPADVAAVLDWVTV